MAKCQNNINKTKTLVKMSEMKIVNLPDEIILKIFLNLSTYDIRKSICLVCKDFYRLSQDSTLIRDVYLGPKLNKIPEKYVLEVLRLSNHLTKLILEDLEEADLIIYTLILSCPKLKHLELIECYLSNECFETLIDASPNLEYLTLDGSCINSQMEKLAQLEFLKSLRLSGYNYKFDAKDLTSLAVNCKTLQNLKIDWVCRF